MSLAEGGRETTTADNQGQHARELNFWPTSTSRLVTRVFPDLEDLDFFPRVVSREVGAFEVEVSAGIVG
jgi:hypothetical protein